MNILDTIAKEQQKDNVTPFNVGDTVKVHCRVIEGGKERVQIFQGIVIARRGSGINEAFTVRKIAYGEGVERSFAIQAGREIRIMVKPDDVKDDGIIMVARDIVKRIENELEYPGQIKVNVIRETRAIEYAK